MNNTGMNWMQNTPIKDKYSYFGLEPETFNKMQQIQKTSQPRLPPNLETVQQRSCVTTPCTYPQLGLPIVPERPPYPSEPIISPSELPSGNIRTMPFATREPHDEGLSDEGMRLMGQEENFQQRFVDFTFEMVKRRYDDISPPATTYLTNTLKPLDLQKKASLAVTGTSPYSNRINENITPTQENNDSMYSQYSNFPEVAGNAQHVPANYFINRVQDDIRELPQNFAQSTQQRNNQSFQMDQQRYEEMAQYISYPQVPPLVEPYLYNPQPSGLQYRHTQMPVQPNNQISISQHVQPPIQQQLHRSKTFPGPNCASGQSVNHRRQQNDYNSPNNTNYNSGRPSRGKLQRQQASLPYYRQQNTNNLNATRQQNWSQEQQRLLQQMYKHQRLYQYYQDLYQKATILKNMQDKR